MYIDGSRRDRVHTHTGGLNSAAQARVSDASADLEVAYAAALGKPIWSPAGIGANALWRLQKSALPSATEMHAQPKVCGSGLDLSGRGEGIPADIDVLTRV